MQVLEDYITSLKQVAVTAQDPSICDLFYLHDDAQLNSIQSHLDNVRMSQFGFL